MPVNELEKEEKCLNWTHFWAQDFATKHPRFGKRKNYRDVPRLDYIGQVVKGSRCQSLWN